MASKTMVIPTIQTKRIRLTLTEPMLGTMPADENLASRFYATQHPDTDPNTGELSAEAQAEVDGIPAEALEDLDLDKRGLTVFRRDDNGQPIFPTHMLRGLFVSVQDGFNRAGAKYKLSAYKKVITSTITFKEREVPFILEKPLEKDELLPMEERSLRAETMQGPRTALVKSERLPAGTQVEITLQLVGDDAWKRAQAYLDHGGIATGLGQWRNAGFGRFSWEEIK